MRSIPQESVHSEEIKQIWAMFGETDRKFQESDRKFQETSREIREGYQELRKLFKETDKKFQETDRKFKETDRRIGDITGKWGRFVEGLVVPAMVSLFAKRGIEIERISQRVKVRKKGGEMEVDVLGVNGEYAVPVEVKSTLGDFRKRIYRKSITGFQLLPCACELKWDIYFQKSP